MANPLIPGISATEQDLLYKKLSIYNQKKASFKEAGAYLVVLPRTDYPRYSLWVYSPLPERQSIFYIFDLNEDVHEALRIASTLCYYSLRPLLLVEYNAKRMQNRGDDIISFGKYHGHYLHEILRIHRHPATKSQTALCRTFSGQGRGESGESHIDRSQCPSGGRSL